MNVTSGRLSVGPSAVALVECFDAVTLGRTVHVIAFEERPSRALFAALQDYGFGFHDVVDHPLEADIVDAPLARPPPIPARPSPPWCQRP